MEHAPSVIPLMATAHPVRHKLNLSFNGLAMCTHKSWQAVIQFLSRRIRLRGILVENLQVQLIRPPMLKLFNIADDFIPLPETKGIRYYLDFIRNCKCLPECYLLFTNSLRGDFESLVSGSPQRFGMILPNRIRPLLSHSFDTVNIKSEDISTLHQSRLWEKMMNRYIIKALALTLVFLRLRRK